MVHRCGWQDRQRLCIHREIHPPWWFFVNMLSPPCFYMPLIKILVLPRYKYTQKRLKGSSGWQWMGNWESGIGPSTLRLYLLVRLRLATVASRLTTSTVIQNRQTPCRHWTQECKTTSPTNQVSQNLWEGMEMEWWTGLLHWSFTQMDAFQFSCLETLPRGVWSLQN